MTTGKLTEQDKAALTSEMRALYSPARSFDWALKWILFDGTVLCGSAGHQDISEKEAFTRSVKKSGMRLDNYMSAEIAKALSQMIGALHIFTTNDKCYLFIYEGNTPNLQQLSGLVDLYNQTPPDVRKPLEVQFQAERKKIELPDAPDMKARLDFLAGRDSSVKRDVKSKIELSADQVNLESLLDACKEMGLETGRNR